ncbi:PAS domain S-box protein [Aliishimia ponticola]|uniref:histidine kinase n=1 Tax=Aliishimia ponticola TaxID=2499833 RepID=A0A4S4NGH2_9RHOB|nr:PAS domain S-box protein [Aliishimia ponticola]THH35160.1 PAS domain S-box protein [Aliishimia ponticola]
MTQSAPPDRVSRARYERERRARNEAESILEDKARELYDINQKLLRESEALRVALAETEAARSREAGALREQSILSQALTALSGKSGAAEAVQDLLLTLRAAFSGYDACFLQTDDGVVSVATSVVEGHSGLQLPVAPDILSRPRRLGNLRAVANDDLPGHFGQYASIILVPLQTTEAGQDGLLLASRKAGHFSAADLRVLDRVARVAAQSLKALREARRNALLVSLIEGRAVDEKTSGLDAPLEAVHRAFARLTDMQGAVVSILDGLLSAPLQTLDVAIMKALALMGELTSTDRVCVSRLSFDGTTLGMSHEWCAPGVESVADATRKIPVDAVPQWREQLSAGQDVIVTDIDDLPNDAPERDILGVLGTVSLLAVPMLRDGDFSGLITYENLSAQRSFLPGEVHLLRSVAKVIASLLARRDAETRLLAAHAETASERQRLESVLAAMPDLVVELDHEGRFVMWHSGAIVVPEEISGAFEGQLLESVLPPDLAAEAREVLNEIDAGEVPKPRNFPFALVGDWERVWQLSASALGERGYLFVLRDITEIREQTALIERLSDIARRTSNLVVMTDADCRITWVNEAFTKTSGWPLDEVLGRNPGHFLQCDETDPATVALLREGIAQGKPVQADILNQSRDGEKYWVALDIQPVRDEDGVISGFMAVEVDVTEQREQADALRVAADDAARTRATLVAAVEALQDGFVLYDSEDRLVLCNQRYRELYKQSAEVIRPGERFEDILRYGLERGQYQDALGREEEWLAERLKRHRESDSEIEQELADGRWLRIFEKATPNGGRVGLRVDITALKMAEKRAEADRAAAMEASQDGIAITDDEGRFLYMNKAHLELFGYESEAQVIGKPWTMLYAPEEAAWMQSNALPKLQRDGNWTGEIAGLARDGSPVDQDVSLTVKDDGGLLCIARDMRDRRRETEERERLREELQLAQRREVVGQMAAGLAHDFNNLLATISGGALLIKDAADPRSLTATGAQRIQAATDQAAGLVKRLLSLGRHEASPVALDLRTPLREACDLVRAGLRAPTRLTLNLPDTPVNITADPTDILQLVLNLAINARDALAGAPGQIAVSLDAVTDATPEGPFSIGTPEPGQRFARIVVADTGPGMSPELAARAFKPYETTKGAGGSGLGLAIVSSVVSAAGGALRLDTAPGKGTTFTIYWPEHPKGAEEPARVEGVTGRLDGRSILLLDDHEDLLQIITAFLEAAGAEVAPTSEPSDVLEALEDNPQGWDLLITDFDMPKMTGTELAQKARAIAPELPVILVTALAGIAGRRDAGIFDAVLGKPVDKDRLVYKAEEAILRAQTKED